MPAMKDSILTLLSKIALPFTTYRRFLFFFYVYLLLFYDYDLVSPQGIKLLIYRGNNKAYWYYKLLIVAFTLQPWRLRRETTHIQGAFCHVPHNTYMYIPTRLIIEEGHNVIMLPSFPNVIGLGMTIDKKLFGPVDSICHEIASPRFESQRWQGLQGSRLWLTTQSLRIRT